MLGDESAVTALSETVGLTYVCKLAEDEAEPETRSSKSPVPKSELDSRVCTLPLYLFPATIAVLYTGSVESTAIEGSLATVLARENNVCRYGIAARTSAFVIAEGYTCVAVGFPTASMHLYIHAVTSSFETCVRREAAS